MICLRRRVTSARGHKNIVEQPKRKKHGKKKMYHVYIYWSLYIYNNFCIFNILVAREGIQSQLTRPRPCDLHMLLDGILRGAAILVYSCRLAEVQATRDALTEEVTALGRRNTELEARAKAVPLLREKVKNLHN